ncbi:MAG TPA: hypothetical protein VFO65_11280 [Acidimicrobiales bacterium]|nr:hypothetical protein [Acidimicrobiales bacterium]
MATGRSETVFELRPARSNRTVVVLVSDLDRRLVPAIRFVAGLRQVQLRAMHVSVDPDRTRRLADDWADLGLSWLPLEIEPPAAGGVAESVAAALRREASEDNPVTVVVPELDFPRRWQGLLHRRSARRIAGHLQAVPGVTAVVVPSFVDAGAAGAP